MIKFRPSLRSQLMLMLLSVGVSAMLAIAYFGYHSGEVHLTQRIFEQLTSVRASKAYQMQSYFDSMRNQTEALSEDLMVVNAMKDFKRAYRGLDAKAIPETWLNSIDSYYKDQFLPRLADLHEGAPIADLYEPHDSASQYLQYHYIASNSNPAGNKLRLDDAGDGSEYSKAHALYHPRLSKYHDLFGYNDLFLVDPDSGAIIYSIGKEVDLGMSLATGPYRDSNLADAINAAINAKAKGFVKIVDFAHYKPSYGAPAAFIASPIFDGDEFIGVLGLQVPVDEINRVMTGNNNWAKDGLGRSGEAYLVGADSAMRSVSRFLVEDPAGYLETLSALNVKSQTIDDIERYGTSILEQRMDTEATRNALERREGTMIVEDYRGVKVLSSYSPLNLNGLDWAVLSEMDLDEAYAPINEFKRNILFWGSLIILLITVASLLLSSVFIQPVMRLIGCAKDIGSGEINALADSENPGEFGELATALAGMVDGLDTQTKAIEKLSLERWNLLQKLLPSEVAQRLLNGEATIADPVENASVMFTEVSGLEAFKDSISTEQRVRLVNDLVCRFDSAADECGVDKIKLLADRYVSASGLVGGRLDHMGRMIKFALELQKRVKNFNHDHGTDLDVISSIHSGDVVVGTVGSSKMAYDVWGDTVSTANSILAQGKPSRGSILVSQPVFEFLQDVYYFDKLNPDPSSGSLHPLIPMWRFVGAAKQQLEVA